MKIIIATIFFLLSATAYGAAPDIGCAWLPGCDAASGTGEDGIYGIIGWIIWLMIQYVAVLAVIAVMIGWIMYIISSGEEEKTKKAKTIITWALVWVFLSVTAWSIIGILNNFRI